MHVNFFAKNHEIDLQYMFDVGALPTSIIIYHLEAMFVPCRIRVDYKTLLHLSNLSYVITHKLDLPLHARMHQGMERVSVMFFLSIKFSVILEHFMHWRFARNLIYVRSAQSGKRKNK